MLEDVRAWAKGQPNSKLVSKETLNHPQLIERITGLDVYEQTPQAYRRAYEALGIDIINRVPMQNAPPPTPPRQTRHHPSQPRLLSHLGVYDTWMHTSYPCQSPEEVLELDMIRLRYEDLLVPVPHPCKHNDIQNRERYMGNVGLYYPMPYYTLFMWGVEVLGWETFMLAASLYPDQFHNRFLKPCAAKSQAIVEEIVSSSDSPFLFLHDDLASAQGPIFKPEWYDRYIFPHYPDIWSAAKQQGKKIILVADGNMTEFLPRLIECGVDGLMFENPATPLENVIEYFGKPGRYLIGGIETALLTNGSPKQVYEMVVDLKEKTSQCPGFAIACCGGLHGNISMQNLEAYFDAKAEIGATPHDWRKRCHV